MSDQKKYTVVFALNEALAEIRVKAKDAAEARDKADALVNDDDFEPSANSADATIIACRNGWAH